MKRDELPGASQQQVSEVARRSLRLLAERRLAPTPTAFAAAYAEVAAELGVPITAEASAPAGADRTAPGAARAGARAPGGPSAEPVFKVLIKDLVRSNRMPGPDAVRAIEAIARTDWILAQDIIEKALARRTGATASNWPALTSLLLKQTDALHAQWTRGRKVEAVARVLEGAGEQPDVAHERLVRLIESWGTALATPAVEPAPVAAETAPLPRVLERTERIERTERDAARASGAAASTASSSADLLATARQDTEAWKAVALRAIKLLEQSCREGTPARQNLRDYAARSAAGFDDTSKLLPRFVDVVGALDRQLADDHKVRMGLQRLLALLCDNMRTLAPEEAWLTGQLEPIRALLTGPIEPRQLADAEARLAQIVAHQSSSRRGLQDAKVALKEMLRTLITGLSSMGASTGRFYEQIGGYQRELEGANDFATLQRVIQGLMTDTDAARTDIARSREDLLDSHRRVEAYEVRVQSLERELAEVSALVQHDPLTHTLNRRGLDEVFRIESARARRHRTPLVAMMIDLDDFKRVNDTIGHEGGDRVLVHVVTTLGVVLRPSDLIARTGGEEFVVLFPVTELADASVAAARILAELAQRAFVYDGKETAISFSGGLAQWHAEESLEALLRRADAAMYEAKRSGKACVRIAPSPEAV